jgi:hypothetical protein
MKRTNTFSGQNACFLIIKVDGTYSYLFFEVLSVGVMIFIIMALCSSDTLVNC